MGPVATTPTPSNNQISLLWYPKDGYFVFSHVALAAGNQVAAFSCGLDRESDLDNKEERARAGKAHDFFKVNFKTQESAAENLRQRWVREEGSENWKSCVAAASQELREEAGVTIPFPFSQVPVLAISYLWACAKLGTGNVANIEFVGHRRPFFAVLGTEIFCESGFCAAATWGLYAGITAALPFLTEAAGL